MSNVTLGLYFALVCGVIAVIYGFVMRLDFEAEYGQRQNARDCGGDSAGCGSLLITPI